MCRCRVDGILSFSLRSHQLVSPNSNVYLAIFKTNKKNIFTFFWICNVCLLSRFTSWFWKRRDDAISKWYLIAQEERNRKQEDFLSSTLLLFLSLIVPVLRIFNFFSSRTLEIEKSTNRVYDDNSSFSIDHSMKKMLLNFS